MKVYLEVRGKRGSGKTLLIDTMLKGLKEVCPHGSFEIVSTERTARKGFESLEATINHEPYHVGKI